MGRVIIGILVGLALYVLMLRWYFTYEDPRTPVQLQIWEECQNW